MAPRSITTTNRFGPPSDATAQEAGLNGNNVVPADSLRKSRLFIAVPLPHRATRSRLAFSSVVSGVILIHLSDQIEAGTNLCLFSFAVGVHCAG
jgi:hypothetical protein